MVNKKIIILSILLFLYMILGSNIVCSLTYAETLMDAQILELIKSAPSSRDLPGIAASYLLMEEKDFFNEDDTATYELHIVCKILDSQAIPLGEVSVPYNSSRSTLDINLARTIKPDNTVINVAKENIIESSPYSQLPLYSNIKIKQFSMPAVEVGSVIEYKATLKVFKPEMPGLAWSYWSFPPGVSVELSTLEINIPENTEGKFIARNLNVTPEISTKDGRKIYKWTARNVFIEGVYEPFLPPYDNVCPNLTFAISKEWDEFAKWFYNIVEPQMEPNQEMKDFVENIKNRKGGNRLKIMEELYNFVSQDIRYVSIPLKSSEYQPHKVVDIYTNRYGDCKDKSTLLISLYKIAGIDAYFALLKPRYAGPLVKEFPALDFIHSVVAVPKEEGGWMLLDPTLELNRFGYIPTDMEDVDIFIVKKDGYEFIKIPIEYNKPNGLKTIIEMEIGEGYVIDVNEKATFFGESEINTRLNAKYSTRDAARAYFEQVLQSLYAKAKLIDFDYPNPDDLDENFWINFNYEVRDHIKEAGNMLIFDLPINISGMSTSISTQDRKHPLWFPIIEESTSTINITIPPDCKINYLPSGIEKDTLFGYYKRETSGSKDKISITYYLKIKMLEITPEQYKEYKEFIESVVKSVKESIVLEKI